jgi:hypothetical protein
MIQYNDSKYVMNLGPKIGKQIDLISIGTSEEFAQ